MSKIKIEIKSRWSDKILFEYKKENNTLKDTLKKAILEGANLSEADLSGANLSEADLSRANLRGADLSGADLNGANLSEADLSRANLSGADLSGADLSGANLRGADLSGADLNGANLEGTNLERASLCGASLCGASLYMWDGGDPDINEIINKLENGSNLKIKRYYINKHILSPAYKIYWKNGLIVDEYEVVEPKAKEMTISEISEALGYEVKAVKEHE